MTLKTTSKKTFRGTRAYWEGYHEGRIGLYKRNPYTGERQQEINDWNEGWSRGNTLKHFHEETKSKDADINAEVLRIRRQTGEKC